ncbi:MAG TPA: LacI family transcriptional regulator, partial [Mycobacterium sp.]
MKRFLSAVLGIATVGVLAACGSGPAPGGGSDGGGEGGRITMGFSQVGAESGWRTANTTSIQDAAKAADVDLKFSDAN